MIDVVGMAPKTARDWVIETLLEFLKTPEAKETVDFLMDTSPTRFNYPRVVDLIRAGGTLEEIARDRISIIYTDRGRHGFNIKIESCGCWCADAIDYFNSLTDTPFNSVVVKETNNVFRVYIK